MIAEPVEVKNISVGDEIIVNDGEDIDTVIGIEQVDDNMLFYMHRGNHHTLAMDAEVDRLVVNSM